MHACEDSWLGTRTPTGPTFTPVPTYKISDVKSFIKLDTTPEVLNWLSQHRFLHALEGKYDHVRQCVRVGAAGYNR